MQADANEGGVFEMFGGSVIGKYIKLDQDKEVLLDWRFRNWQESDVSKVINLDLAEHISLMRNALRLRVRLKLI